MEKENIKDDGNTDLETSVDFAEQFNQLELLETHGHLIPTGTQSLWVGNSDDEEEQEEKNEEWYQLQEKKMEKDPSKLLLWAAEKNRVKKRNHYIIGKVFGLEPKDPTLNLNLALPLGTFYHFWPFNFLSLKNGSLIFVSFIGVSGEVVCVKVHITL